MSTARVDGVTRGSSYEIQFEGTLDIEPSAWLDDLSCRVETCDEDGLLTRLTLYIADQAALRGVLNRLWDVNLTLTCVRRVGAVSDKGTDDGC